MDLCGRFRGPEGCRIYGGKAYIGSTCEGLVPTSRNCTSRHTVAQRSFMRLAPTDGRCPGNVAGAHDKQQRYIPATHD
jgi:hypothetical protein